jgi:hypothetical protein
VLAHDKSLCCQLPTQVIDVNPIHYRGRSDLIIIQRLRAPAQNGEHLAASAMTCHDTRLEALHNTDAEDAVGNAALGQSRTCGTEALTQRCAGPGERQVPHRTTAEPVCFTAQLSSSCSDSEWTLTQSPVKVSPRAGIP